MRMTKALLKHFHESLIPILHSSTCGTHERRQTMITIEIRWNDLTRAKQKEIQQQLGLDENDNNNWDLIPMA